MLEGDQILTRQEVVDLTEHPVVTFYEGGQSRYGRDGSYSYEYASGGTAFGTFEVRPDAVVCILFANGRDRCDRFVRSHGRIVMITQSGDRFPVRP